MDVRKKLFVLGGIVAAALLAGCTPLNTFERRFGSHQPVRASAPNLAGSWSGYWKSTSSGHTGCLEAIITCDGPCSYSAKFHATFFQIFSMEYRIPLRAWRDGDLVRFEGQRFLLAGGMYRCSGYASATCFRACYDSKIDKGVFVMSRRAGNCPVCCCVANDAPCAPEGDQAPEDAPAAPAQ